MAIILFMFLITHPISATELIPVKNDCKFLNKDSIECKRTQQKKERKGCCKLQYPGKGFDYLMTTEEECLANEYYHQFLGERSSLCLEWEDKK
ncbi:MAG: hypothetical protein K8R21_05365 [Leptospira sp.]|nr:hypothetical protein [Leptospira sp.]